MAGKKIEIPPCSVLKVLLYNDCPIIVEDFDRAVLTAFDSALVFSLFNVAESQPHIRGGTQLWFSVPCLASHKIPFHFLKMAIIYIQTLHSQFQPIRGPYEC